MAEKNAEFPAVSARLRAILQKYERGAFNGKQNAGGYDYQLIGPVSEFMRNRELWFGGVRTGKAYVSYHLMPAYMFPDLLDGISPDLKKHIQGKSCFNFRHVDESLFKELARLTERAYKRCRQEKLLDRRG